MRFTTDQLETYQADGFLFLPGYLPQSLVATLKAELPVIFAEDTPRRVLEKDGKVIRSIYGSHKTNKVFSDLSRYTSIVEPVIQLLASDVYIYQFKINAKAGMGGDMWEWHQDFIFWHKEDGIPEARMINVVVFLDDVNEFNGPLLLIPRSQHEGLLDANIRSSLPSEYSDSPSWITSLTANLKYSLDKEIIAQLVSQYGIVGPKGPSGSVLFFHSNLVHGSASNMSPFGRSVAIITYNSVINTPPLLHRKQRPDFLQSDDHTPLVPLAIEGLQF